jgi:hypothetical protein
MTLVFQFMLMLVSL